MSAPATTVGIATTVLAATEVVLATSLNISSAPPGGSGYNVRGVVNYTANATPGTIILRVRQNTLTGTAIYTSNAFIPVASVAATVPFEGLDTAVASAGGVSQYVLTATFTQAPTAVNGVLTIQETEDAD